MRAGKVWLMKTFCQRGTETPLSACSRPVKAGLLHSLHECVHGFNYMLNEDERLLLAKQHVLSVLSL